MQMVLSIFCKGPMFRVALHCSGEGNRADTIDTRCIDRKSVVARQKSNTWRPSGF